MKINLFYKRSAETQAYIDMMANSRPRFDKPIPTTIQATSTQATLDRDPSKDQEQFNRELDLSKAYAQAIDLSQMNDPEYRDKVVGARKLTPEEIMFYKAHRQSSRNTLGESTKSSAGEARKERARQAFEHSHPAPLTEVQIEKLTRLTEISQLKTWKEEWRPMTTWEAFKHWIKGGKVKQVEEKK